MRILGYIVFYQDIQIEKEWIKAICDLPELYLVYDIQVMLEFANVYSQFLH